MLPRTSCLKGSDHSLPSCMVPMCAQNLVGGLGSGTTATCGTAPYNPNGEYYDDGDCNPCSCSDLEAHCSTNNCDDYVGGEPDAWSEYMLTRPMGSNCCEPSCECPTGYTNCGTYCDKDDDCHGDDGCEELGGDHPSCRLECGEQPGDILLACVLCALLPCICLLPR